MPLDIELDERDQTAVLWEATGMGLYGDPALADPVELAVRWEEGRKEVVDPRGNVVRVDATVVVDREVPAGSRLWLGALDDLPGTALTPESDVMVVQFTDRTPDLKNRAVRRVLMLTRWKDSLATP